MTTEDEQTMRPELVAAHRAIHRAAGEICAAKIKIRGRKQTFGTSYILGVIEGNYDAAKQDLRWLRHQLRHTNNED